MRRARHIRYIRTRITHHPIHAGGIMALLSEQSTYEGETPGLMVRYIYP